MYQIDLTGKRCLVMGVANHRSIAWHIATTLKDAGASLAFTYPTERIRKEIDHLTDSHDSPLVLKCDVSSDEEIDQLFADLRSRWDSLDVLIHSLAFASRQDLGRELIEASRPGFEGALDISAYSLIACARSVLPLMTVRESSIITLSYEAAHRAYPGYSVMGVAKAALENVVKQLAAEVGPKGVRVNALSPGPIDTLSARSIRGFSRMKRYHEQVAPLRRNTTQSDIAGAALFLASDLSNGVTGATIPVDSGFGIVGVPYDAADV